MARTVVFFHAHPDDEAIATGGTMARLADEGHRVVLVLATRGEEGIPREGILDPGEELGDRRSAETRDAGTILGASRVAFLGYRDSGMMGESTNDHPQSFWSADLDEAAGRLALILEEEHPDVLTVYDDHGGYGHPDHIQVHRVGVRAAELVGGGIRIYESTVNRDRLMDMMPDPSDPESAATLDVLGLDVEGVAQMRERVTRLVADGFGSPGEVITTTVDVSSHTGRKRAAMRAHASQIGPDDFFLQLPDAVFQVAFGQEHFIRRDVPSSHHEDSLLADLPDED